MKKVEVINLLNENNIPFSDEMTYLELMKRYNKWNSLSVDKRKSYLFDLKRGETMKEIMVFLPNIMKKTSGTHAEVAQMFRLYNTYYRANETPSCSQCVSNVYNRLVILYNRSK